MACVVLAGKLEEHSKKVTQICDIGNSILPPDMQYNRSEASETHQKDTGADTPGSNSDAKSAPSSTPRASNDDDSVIGMQS